ALTPARQAATPLPSVLTEPGERPPGTWRYSSRLALALSGGGARAAYQVGVLARLAGRLPGLEFPILTGRPRGAHNSSLPPRLLWDVPPGGGKAAGGVAPPHR